MARVPGESEPARPSRHRHWGPDPGTIVGFAHVCPTRDDDEQGHPVGELTSIYLHPDHWGHGLGHPLMGHALDLLTQAGNSTATLWVLDRNLRAIHFYEANGWNPDGAIKYATIGDTPITENRYRTTLQAQPAGTG